MGYHLERDTRNINLLKRKIFCRREIKNYTIIAFYKFILNLNLAESQIHFYHNMLNFKSLFILLVLYQSHAEPKYSVEQIDVYTPNYYRGEAVLKMDYASSIIKNPKSWKTSDNSEIISVSLIFSDYPKRKTDWIINYDTLLNHRIRALKRIIPQIDSMPQVTWKVIFQTACQNEEEARKLFHGIVIKYRTKIPRSIFANYKIIREIIHGQVGLKDSTVFKVLERNRWQNMLVVNDWTSSMYPYGAQVVLWHRLNNLSSSIKAFVFFNDGNQKKKLDKKIGETGGLWLVKANTIKAILKTIRRTMINGSGGDITENDIEALLYGLKRNPNAIENVILIADNSSPIRDKILIPDLTEPIKIIICNGENKPIHPHYLSLAYQTKGSIHTIEQDIIDLTNLQTGQKIKIGRFEYQLQNGRLKRK